MHPVWPTHHSSQADHFLGLTNFIHNPRCTHRCRHHILKTSWPHLTHPSICSTDTVLATSRPCLLAARRSFASYLDPDGPNQLIFDETWAARHYDRIRLQAHLHQPHAHFIHLLRTLQLRTRGKSLLPTDAVEGATVKVQSCETQCGTKSAQAHRRFVQYRGCHGSFASVQANMCPVLPASENGSTARSFPSNRAAVALCHPSRPTPSSPRRPSCLHSAILYGISNISFGSGTKYPCHGYQKVTKKVARKVTKKDVLPPRLVAILWMRAALVW